MYMQFEFGLLMSYMYSGRQFLFLVLHCGVVVFCDIMMDGFARVSVVLIRDLFVF